MAPSDVDVVRALFERLRQDRLEDALELLSDDFVAVIPPSMSAEPDVYEGLDGARRYMEGFQGLIDAVRFEPTDLFEEDGRVIAIFRLSGRGVSSGIELEQRGVGALWVREGKIARIEAHPDLETARSAR
jgi:ketosteroid isomerase-like protein